MKLDTQEKIVNQNTFRVRRHRVKMEERVDNPVTIRTNANVHQVNKLIILSLFSYSIEFRFINFKIV